MAWSADVCFSWSLFALLKEECKLGPPRQTSTDHAIYYGKQNFLFHIPLLPNHLPLLEPILFIVIWGEWMVMQEENFFVRDTSKIVLLLLLPRLGNPCHQ